MESVMIDAVEYKVKKVKAPLMVEGDECNGSIDPNSAIISIVKGLNGNEAQVLMHEIVHGILHERGFDAECAKEHLVDSLASGFINLIRSNGFLLLDEIFGDCDGECDECKRPCGASKKL
jgi:hypothetical protein